MKAQATSSEHTVSAVFVHLAVTRVWLLDGMELEQLKRHQSSKAGEQNDKSAHTQRFVSKGTYFAVLSSSRLHTCCSYFNELMTAKLMCLSDGLQCSKFWSVNSPSIQLDTLVYRQRVSRTATSSALHRAAVTNCFFHFVIFRRFVVRSEDAVLPSRILGDAGAADVHVSVDIGANVRPPRFRSLKGKVAYCNPTKSRIIQSVSRMEVNGRTGVPLFGGSILIAI